MEEKQKVWREITIVDEYDLEGTIDDAIALLNKYKAENLNKILRLEVIQNRWEEGSHLELQYEDEETNEEFELRIQKEKEQNESTTLYEKKQLAKLKAKYE